MAQKWISVKKYSQKIGVKNPQTVYNWIANGKLKKNKDWREITITIKRKQVLYKK